MPWLLLALAFGGLIPAIDWTIDDSLALDGFYAVPPLLASLRAGPRWTAAVSVIALALAVVDALAGPDHHLVPLAIVAVAGGCAVAMALLRQRAEDAARAADERHRRAAFLAKAGMLLESSLDYEERLRNVARLAVPGMADWAAVEIVQDDGSIERMAIAHVDPGKEAIAQEYSRRWPVDPGDPTGPAAVIRDDHPLLVPEISSEMLAAAIPDPDQLRILRELGLTSTMVVPLRGRDRVLGAMSLTTAESGRRYDDDDLAMAQELAQRCAMAIENAHLYQAVQVNEERFRRLVADVGEYAIFALDREGRVTSWNAGARQILGYEESEIVGGGFICFRTEEDIEAGKPERELERAASEDGRHEMEGWRVRKDGSRFMAHVVTTALHADDGTLLGFTKVMRDVTERMANDERLSHQALHDGLTALPNRTLFLDRLSHALERSDRRPGSPALLFLDVDHFKAVNDMLGHAAGDELLKGVASRLREAVRLEDTVARFAGDEFAVLCEDLAEQDDAIVIAERIIASLRRPLRIAGRDLVAQASVGIVFAGDQAETPEAMLQDADTAMYRAKRQGTTRYEVFHERMRPDPVEGAAVEGALRSAVEDDGFHVVYQPIVDLQRRRVVGAETLLRLSHPTRGELEPVSFLPFLDETGHIHSVGAFALKAACAQGAAWAAQTPDEAPLTLFVNVSATQLSHPDFTEQVAEILSETSFAAESLCFEIGEAALMRESRETMQALLALKGIGVRLAIDHFGTGQSSLNKLQRFTVDYLKVGGTLVAGLGRRSEDGALVTGMTSMAHALGLSVVAVGVETPVQLAEAARIGCDLAQGYHLARPQTAEALEHLLRDGRMWRAPEAAVS